MMNLQFNFLTLCRFWRDLTKNFADYTDETTEKTNRRVRRER